MGGAQLSTHTRDLRERFVGPHDEGIDIVKTRFTHNVAHAPPKSLAAAAFQSACGDVPPRRQFRNAQVESARRADFLKKSDDHRVVRLCVGRGSSRCNRKGGIQKLALRRVLSPH